MPSFCCYLFSNKKLNREKNCEKYVYPIGLIAAWNQVLIFVLSAGTIVWAYVVKAV